MIHFSFGRKFKDNKGSSSITHQISNVFAGTISNIEDAHIQLKGLFLKELLDNNLNILFYKIIEHYKQGIGSTILKLLFSVNIIGNPIGLWSTIQSSVNEVIERPSRKGNSHGPLDYLQDASYVLRRTGMGVCDSFNRITKSLSDGISLLTLDQKYI